MVMDTVFSILHWWLVFMVITALVTEMNLCRGSVDAVLAKRLGRVDMIYGIGAVALVIVGFGRAMHGAKGWAFYSGNPFFWTKIGLFLVIGLLSIAPTVAFFKWNKQLRAGGHIEESRVMAVRRWIHFEMMLLILIPIAAALMARGIGL